MSRGNGKVTIDELAEITGCSCATIQVNAKKLLEMMKE